MLDLPIQKKRHPGKKRIKKEGSCGKGQSSTKPVSSQLVRGPPCWSARQLRQQTRQTAREFGWLVNRQPPGRCARSMASQAIRRLPERGGPDRLMALAAGQLQSYFRRQCRKICQTPEKKKIEPKPRPRKKKYCWPVSQPKQPARRLPSFAPGGLLGSWQANLDPCSAQATWQARPIR